MKICICIASRLLMGKNIYAHLKQNGAMMEKLALFANNGHIESRLLTILRSVVESNRNRLVNLSSRVPDLNEIFFIILKISAILKT